MTRSRDVADTQDNLGGAVAPFVAGKNFIINGGMDIWQRGTTFSAGSTYNADRWWGNNSAITTSWARESTIVPAGFAYSMKVSQATNSAYALAAQPIETANVLALAGQTVTLSVYLASSASMTITPVLNYSTSTDVAPGGTWTAITPTSGGSFTINGTTFTRNSTVFAIPSTAKSLKIEMINTSLAVGAAFYFTGVQLEIGSVATPFARAGGSIGGELALCQRYYYRTTGNTSAGGHPAFCATQSAASAYCYMPLPVTMRTNPSAIDYSGVRLVNYGVAAYAITSLNLSSAETSPSCAVFTADGASGMTANRPVFLYASASTNYIGFSAEL
jgi:hypothetical protein